MDEQKYSKKLDELLSKMSLNVARLTKRLSDQVMANVKQGMTVSKAVDKAFSAINFTTAFQEAAVAAIFEAACAGYGIDPKMVADEEGIKKTILFDSWAPDKKLLSTRIHGMSDEVRQNIVDELTAAMKRHAGVVQAARDLFTGYGYGTLDYQTYLFEDGEAGLKKITGKDVLNEAELPKYLERLKESAKKAINDPTAVNALMKEAQKSAKILQQNSSNMAPTKALKAAYSDLIKAAQTLNEQALEKAVYVAAQERTRYYAERIARTEMARAAHDGFLAKYQGDDLVVAYKWVLSSRHKLLPFDQCDVCKNADVGYGPGIYPKDKVPSIPRHPHCMCRLVPVYRKPDGEFNPDGAKDYIDRLSDSQRQALFGVDGAKAYVNGADWQDKLRGWDDGFESQESRFKTDNFVDKVQKKEYTSGKEKLAKWFDSEGRPKWPPNDGFDGEPEKLVLSVGTLIDRYGDDKGRFVSPLGTSYSERALCPGSQDRTYVVYEVTKSIEVLEGKAKPWFDEPGGGTQYKFSQKIRDLVENGYLIEVKQDD